MGSPELARHLEPATRELVAVAGVRPGMRVLDVGGAVALAAAAAGADVTAVRVAGVERTPFAGGEFDAVLSSFGVMFHPQPREAVAELLRVGRPGAPVALTAFASTGFMAELLDLAIRRRPGASRPARWGRFESAFLWLGSDVEGFELEQHSLDLRFDDAGAAWDCFSTNAPEGARDAFDGLLAGSVREDGAVAIDLAYVIVRGHIANAGRAA